MPTTTCRCLKSMRRCTCHKNALLEKTAKPRRPLRAWRRPAEHVQRFDRAAHGQVCSFSANISYAAACPNSRVSSLSALCSTRAGSRRPFQSAQTPQQTLPISRRTRNASALIFLTMTLRLCSLTSALVTGRRRLSAMPSLHRQQRRLFHLSMNRGVPVSKLARCCRKASAHRAVHMNKHATFRCWIETKATRRRTRSRRDQMCHSLALVNPNLSTPNTR
mmetsp:Transcript_3201/g.8863  ORF Transcript_3201/g.8863 Transcript_3201/m.8863 type:complete len:220 (-) Transcript_3201:110-769(-)